MNTCQDARTDRLTKAHSFLPPPPLSHLVLFFSTTPLFCCSVSETPCFVVCLPLTSAHLYRILPAPLSLPLVLSVLSARLRSRLLSVSNLCLILSLSFSNSLPASVPLSQLFTSTFLFFFFFLSLVQFTQT